MKQDIHSSVWKCCAVSLLSACMFVNTYAQTTEKSAHYEAGITVGPSNFLGDLGGNSGKGTPFLKDNNIPMTRLTFGAFVSYHPSELVAFRFGVNFGSLEGDDAIIKNKGGLELARKIRNSDFKSKFIDGLLMAEIYPTTLLEYDQSDIYHKIRPYLAGGIGVFHFNPMGKDPLTGEYVALRPLHTEGQGFAEYPTRKEYKLTQLNMPFGIGIKYFISENVNIAFEIIHRKTFTDYIDDVSTSYIDPSLFYAHMPLAQAQLAERMANKSGPAGSPYYLPGSKRGTATNNDSYYTAGFKLGVRLGNGNRFKNSTSCPVRF
jgi:hypothetical protein